MPNPSDPEQVAAVGEDAALCSKCTKAITGVITDSDTSLGYDVAGVPLQIGARACL